MTFSPSDNKPAIYVKTLGGFSIKVGDREIYDSSNQSKKPWLLLEYLLIFQKKELNPNDLIQIIWADDPGVNPTGALKTLMFRSRKLLEPLGIPPQKLLVQQRGSYSWTQEYTTILDIDEFEIVCANAANRQTPDKEALEYCMRGIEIYKGDFLPKSEYESWVIPVSTYYHSMYQKLVHKAIDLLMKNEDYARIISICQTAVTIEPYDEQIRYALVYSLYKTGQAAQAIDEYNTTIDLFYNEFSISPSDRFKALYKTIRNEEQGINMNLESIQCNLNEEASGGAFYCEYPVFRDLYQLERRAISRTKDSIFLCLLTVSGSDGCTLKTSVLNKAMGHLDASIRSSLRCSDVYTRYSVCQHLILLSNLTESKGDMIMRRIISNFRRMYSRRDIIVEFRLHPLTPWKQETSSCQNAAIV